MGNFYRVMLVGGSFYLSDSNVILALLVLFGLLVFFWSGEGR